MSSLGADFGILRNSKPSLRKASLARFVIRRRPCKGLMGAGTWQLAKYARSLAAQKVANNCFQATARSPSLLFDMITTVSGVLCRWALTRWNGPDPYVQLSAYGKPAPVPRGARHCHEAGLRFRE
jgi:hypothetical protein